MIVFHQNFCKFYFKSLRFLISIVCMYSTARPFGEYIQCILGLILFINNFLPFWHSGQLSSAFSHLFMNLNSLYCKQYGPKSDCSKRERSGLVVECLTRDREAAGLSLTRVTVLCP